MTWAMMIVALKEMTEEDQSCKSNAALHMKLDTTSTPIHQYTSIE
jgi:hypothetical protein